MRVLNLYAGIGGNRKLWDKSHKVVAVEFDSKIAQIYKDFFPEDEVIVGDAHQYLLDNLHNFDFIWSSPPCPTHSAIREMAVKNGAVDLKYPDMTLYQEIIILENFFKGGYVVENVKPYYKPLIPAQERERHLFWANFYIREYDKTVAKHHETIENQQKILGMDLSNYQGIDKTKVLRNCVLPEVGRHILDCYLNQTPRLL